MTKAKASWAVDGSAETFLSNHEYVSLLTTARDNPEKLKNFMWLSSWTIDYEDIAGRIVLIRNVDNASRKKFKRGRDAIAWKSPRGWKEIKHEKKNVMVQYRTRSDDAYGYRMFCFYETGEDDEPRPGRRRPRKETHVRIESLLLLHVVALKPSESPRVRSDLKARVRHSRRTDDDYVYGEDSDDEGYVREEMDVVDGEGEDIDGDGDDELTDMEDGSEQISRTETESVHSASAFGSAPSDWSLVESMGAGASMGASMGGIGGIGEPVAMLPGQPVAIVCPRRERVDDGLQAFMTSPDENQNPDYLPPRYYNDMVDAPAPTALSRSAPPNWAPAHYGGMFGPPPITQRQQWSQATPPRTTRPGFLVSDPPSRSPKPAAAKSASMMHYPWNASFLAPPSGPVAPLHAALQVAAADPDDLGDDARVTGGPFVGEPYYRAPAVDDGGADDGGIDSGGFEPLRKGGEEFRMDDVYIGATPRLVNIDVNHDSDACDGPCAAALHVPTNNYGQDVSFGSGLSGSVEYEDSSGLGYNAPVYGVDP